MNKAGFLDPLPLPKRVLAVYAHPDDAEFFAGGTLALWAAGGAEISLCLVTSGDKGSGDLAARAASLAQTRESEARAAAAVLGIKEVIFLRQPDGEVFPTLDLRRHIVRMIRLKQPEALLSSDPLYRYRGHKRVNHPDHYQVAEAAHGAFYPAARDFLNFPELYFDEGLAPHKTRWLYLALPTAPNYALDITAYRAQQLAALKCHASQIGDPAAFEERMAQNYDREASPEDGPPRFVEYFQVIDLEG
jgi:LmbE family N-acetylglucosaminyl deacetylase